MVLEAIEKTPKKKITERDKEYLALIWLGYTNFEIGGILTVQLNSPKKTFENIYKKLNARNRTNAALIAYIHGIITPELMKEMDEKAQKFLESHPEYYSKKIPKERNY